MRRSPFTLLVCLTLLCMSCVTSMAQDGPINVLIRPPANGPAGESSVLPGDGVYASSADPLEFQQASARGRHRTFAPPGTAKPIVKCKQDVCPVGVSCPAPAASPPCVVPRRLAGQWELGIQTFFAEVGGTVRYPAPYTGFPVSSVSINDDLGIDDHHLLLEYLGKCQFRQNWAFFYSIMPIHLDATRIAENTLYIGHTVIAPGTTMKTNWDFVYQKVGILYQPVFNCSTVVSIRAGWMFNDQKLSVGGGGCPFNRCSVLDRTRNMAFAGIELEKCIRTMCNGGNLSCDSFVDLGFLDNTFVVDVQAGLRYAVPLNCSRWGYAKGGYRYLNFQEDRNDLRWDTHLEGWFAEMGLVF